MAGKPEPKLRRLREGLRSSSFRVEVKGYLENSSVHGFKYCIEQSRPIFERIMWSLVCGLALWYAGLYTVEVWNETPIVSLDSEVYSNRRVPLPALTLCSNAKVAAFSNWGQERTRNKDLHTLRFICGEAFPNSRAISVKRLNETAPELERTCSLDIKEPEGGLLIQRDCRALFQKVLTEQGICYTFNGYRPRDIYRQDVLLGDRLARDFGWQDSSIPRNDHSRASDRCGGAKDLLSNGDLLLSRGPPAEDHSSSWSSEEMEMVESHLYCGNHSLKLNLYTSPSDSGYCTFRNTSGFKVLIHSPKDVPTVGLRRLIWTREERTEFQSIDMSMESEVTVKAEARLTSHSPDLLWFDPEKRGCYGETERYLRYFKSYTKYNCMLECLTNLTLQMCGCADFYMPRLESTEVCTRVNLPCLFDVIDLSRKKDYCSCFPACYQLSYVIQTRTLRDNTEGKWNDTSLTVKMDLNVSLAIRRPSFTDLKVISAAGGIFGIFCGLSVISLVELLYFAIIRACGNYYQDIKRRLH